MGRIVEADENLLKYLEKLSKNCSDGYTVGVIMGQPSAPRDFVVHLARSPEPKSDDDISKIANSAIASSNAFKGNASLSEVSDSWIANHALYVTRMLPGGMYVLGIFIVCPDNVFEDTAGVNKIKSILSSMQKVLGSNKYLHGTATGSSGTEKLVLLYNTKTQGYNCRSIDIKHHTKPCIIRPVDWKFINTNQGPTWQQLDCYYELDDIFPLKISNNDVSIKQQYQSILESVSNVVLSAVMFIDGEVKDGTETLDSILKKKKGNSKQNNSGKQDNKNLTVSMFIPSDFQDVNDMEPQTFRFAGSVSFSGVVCSSVWLHSRSSLTEAHNAIKCDVMRSLQARVQICCDSLENDSITDRVVISEPPRRVLIPLINKICLSDYIFNGEGASEAVLSAQELLDYEISEDKIICDIENPADITEQLIATREISDVSMDSKEDTHTLMIIIGVLVALFVLLLSIFINFYTTWFNKSDVDKSETKIDL